MEATYIRESSNHYLVLPVSDLSAGDYQMPMLLQNRIPGLLPVHRQTIDGMSALYYEVTSYRSLSDCFEAEKLDFDMIRKVVLHMSHAAEEIDRYLLRGSRIVLDPKYVFVSMDREEICFCYDPCSTQSSADSLNSMARFILDHIDYEDRKCTAFAYSLFQESMKESVSITDFTRMALGYEEKEPEQKMVQEVQEEGLGITAAKEMEKNWTKEECSAKKKSLFLKIIILGCLNTVMMTAFFWGIGVLRNYLRPGSIEMMVISAAGIFAASMIVTAAEQLWEIWKARNNRKFTAADIRVDEA